MIDRPVKQVAGDHYLFWKAHIRYFPRDVEAKRMLDKWRTRCNELGIALT